MKYGIIESKDVLANNKLQGLYHLSEGVSWERKIRKNKHWCLEDVADTISNIGLNKRVYTYKENGIPFMSNSDLAGHDPFERCKYVSKEYCNDERMMIKKDMILLTGVGTVGEVFYASKYLDGVMTPRGNIIKISTNGKINSGTLYAFLASKIGKSLLIKFSSGTVQSYIDPTLIKHLPIPQFKDETQTQIQKLVDHIYELRFNANDIVNKARERVEKEANLQPLNSKDYEFYGPHDSSREVSTFTINKLSAVTLNAFNYSKRIKKLKEAVVDSGSIPLSEVLDETKGFFSSPILKRIELDTENSIKLLGQRELFTYRKEGKKLARICEKEGYGVEYGEIIIAGVGTLGESETFCRCEFAGSDLAGQCISEDFIRLKTSNEWHPGYIYAWLSSTIGFRLIRSTHSGTKLCRPIPRILLDIPVPILNEVIRNEIGNQIEKAYQMRYEALRLEGQVISMIEKEIG